MSSNIKGLLKKENDKEDKKEKKVQIIDERDRSLENEDAKRKNKDDKLNTSNSGDSINQEKKAVSFSKESNDFSSLTKEQLIKKVYDVQDKNKREIETQKGIILRLSDEIDDKDRVIGALSGQNKKLLKILEELKQDVDSQLDKVETKKLAEKIKNVKKEATMEEILINKDKELKNAYKMVDILQKDKNDLLKNLTEKSEYSSVVSLEDQVRFLEKKLSDCFKEIKFLKSIAEEHKYCLEHKSVIEKNKKDFHEELKLLKNKNKEMFLRWKEEESKLEKANDQYFNLRKEYDDLRHSLGQKFINDDKKKENILNNSKDAKFKEYIDKNDKKTIEVYKKSVFSKSNEDSKISKNIEKQNEINKKKEEKDSLEKANEKTNTGKKNQNDKLQVKENNTNVKKEEVKDISNSQQDEKKLLFSSKLKEQSGNSEFYYLKMPKTSNNLSSSFSEKVKNSKSRTILPDVNRMSLGSLNQKHFSLKIKDLDEEKHSLFSENEKQELMEILSKDNLEIFEKRFEALDHSKYSLEQKHRLEERKLQKKIMELEDQIQIVDLQLKESEKKIKILQYQIIEHRNENKIVNKKSSEYTKQLEIFNILLREKDQENKLLFGQLQNMQRTLAVEQKRKITPKKEEDPIEVKENEIVTDEVENES